MKHKEFKSQTTKDLKLFNCKFCDKKLQSTQALSIHINAIHEGKREHKCNFCEKSYSDKYQLQKHLLGYKAYKSCSGKASLTHERLKKYKCVICTKTFNQENDCLLHIKENHIKSEQSSKKDNIKSQCGEIFKNANDLLKHIRSHHKLLDVESFQPFKAKLYTCNL